MVSHNIEIFLSEQKILLYKQICGNFLSVKKVLVFPYAGDDSDVT